jgi:acyl phosphate:glycerol-3-phosphate acyltransferase
MDALSWSHYLAALIGGYLLGSIPWGIVLTRLAGTTDIRKIGSGSIGATNVLRTGRKGLAAATLLLDAAKGTAAVLIAMRWGFDTALVAGLGALVGHLFPIWLKFKGGKGVATALGIFLGLSWPVCLAGCVTWLIVAALFRFSSLASLVAIAAAPAYSWYIAGNLPLTQFAFVVVILIWAKHHENIARLLKGTESKIGQKA